MAQFEVQRVTIRMARKYDVFGSINLKFLISLTVAVETCLYMKTGRCWQSCTRDRWAYLDNQSPAGVMP